MKSWVSLAALFCSIIILSSLCFAGPFGLDASMTRDEVIKKVGRSAIVEEKAYESGMSAITVSAVPTPNSHFSTYVIYFAANGKLAAIVASSAPAAIPVINGFLSTYEFLKLDLEDRYGKATSVKRYTASKARWETSIKAKKSVAIAIWDRDNDKLRSLHLRAIALVVDPVDKDRSIIRLAYNFDVSQEPGL